MRRFANRRQTAFLFKTKWFNRRFANSATADIVHYRAEEIHAPKMSGSALKLFRIVLQTPVMGDAGNKLFYKQLKASEVRDLAYNLKLPAMYWPQRLLPESEHTLHEQCAEEMDYPRMLSATNPTLNEIVGINTNTNTKPATTKSWISIEEMSELYKSGEKTPLDIVHEALNAYHSLNPKLNAFTQLNETEILSQAELSTQRWKSNTPLSILDGIPIAVKDEIDVAGYYTTRGTSYLAQVNGRAESDEAIVARIKQLGAIVFGKTNMHEIGIASTGWNIIFGTARNPYSPQLIHDTGGSSSGSAAAVAAGIVPVAIGSDGGGSIRIPASLNGLVGLKATWSRIPIEDSASTSCVHHGFLTNNVRDSIITYMAAAVSDTNNQNQSKRYNPGPAAHLKSVKQQETLRDLTVGVYWDWFLHSQPEVVTQCKQMLTKLEHQYELNVVDVSIPHLSVAQTALAMIFLSEVLTQNGKTARSETDLNGKINYLQDSSFTTLLCARSFDATDLMSAMKIRHWMMQYLQQHIFSKVDILVTPSVPVTAPKYDLRALDSNVSLSDIPMVGKLIRFSNFANLVGNPALTVPVGYSNVDGDGDLLEGDAQLPVGLQLMADHWNEHHLFRVASVIENLVQVRYPPAQNVYSYKL